MYYYEDSKGCELLGSKTGSKFHCPEEKLKTIGKIKRDEES